MKYGFTRGLAHSQITVGACVIGLGIVVGVALFLIPVTDWAPTQIADQPLVRAAAAGAVIAVSLTIALPLILLGELLLVFLDMRHFLARIARQTRRRRALPSDEGLAGRLRARR